MFLVALVAEVAGTDVDNLQTYEKAVPARVQVQKADVEDRCIAMIIEPYSQHCRGAILDLSVRAWAAVFPLTRATVPGFVYECFYPRGWEARQIADIAALLDTEPDNVDVAFDGTTVTGWVCTRIHPDDRMGELYVLAVDPNYQRRGIGSALLGHSLARIRAAGMAMAMVETGDDPGHAPARASYESAGFERWPVARYFKNLD